MKTLALCVPSRGRPHNIGRLWQALKETCEGTVDLLVGLDADDPLLDEYPFGGDWDNPDLDYRAMHYNGPNTVTLRYEVRSGMRQVVGWTNHLAMSNLDRYDYFGQIGDDNVPMTSGWDSHIKGALSVTPFAFANDLYPRAPGVMACHVFTHADVLRKLGYFGPPEMRHMYVDVAWTAWGRKTGISYLHDVVIEHRHFTIGTAPVDESYRQSQSCVPPDLASWHHYSRSGKLNADIAKIDPGASPFTDSELADFNRELMIPEYLGRPV